MRCDGKSITHSASGLTLIELLVALVILSILAAAALPYAELTVRRDKEYELRRALREVRTAIDTFHEDWRAGRIPRSVESASDDGFPRSLATLAEGVDTGQARGNKRYYLRRIPREPFAGSDRPATEQWLLRGYQDSPDTRSWGGRDVYDLRSNSDATAIDGTRYRDW